jgi:broad specificity phosphatase PhoE
LANRIDKNKEVVIFWVSPRKRARQTAEIFLETFQQEGVLLTRNSKSFKSLSDTQLSPAFLEALESNGKSKNWM